VDELSHSEINYADHALEPRLPRIRMIAAAAICNPIQMANGTV
jgi:hypothetical protein